MTGNELIIKLLQSEVDLSRDVRIGMYEKHPEVTYPLIDNIDTTCCVHTIYLEATSGENL